jgi:tetratricopeptide (TPR) repeat protein
MPSTDLAKRFLSDWPAPFTPGAELVYEGPRRQRQLIDIGRQQIDVQKASARMIAKSSIAAAEIIAAEINQQTAILEDSLRKYSEQVSSSIIDAADQIGVALDLLGDRLCAYLGEIRWELVQQSATLAGILHALRESRSNEARQLVEQGVRHYANEQFDRAEERFRQALEKNTTDYQVLMNLGLVAVQKGLSREALAFFEDALRLPTGLDNPSKNRTLLAIARLHYAAADFGNALLAARQAAQFAEPHQVSDIFLLGTYAGLAGEARECLTKVEEAIRLEREFFNKAAVEPNLEVLRPAVLELLSRLATDAENEFNAEMRTARDLLGQAVQHKGSSACVDERKEAQNAADLLNEAAVRASYSDLLKLRTRAEAVSQATRLILEAEGLAVQTRSFEERIPEFVRKKDQAERELKELNHVPPFRIRMWFLWHMLTFWPAAFGMGNGPNDERLAIFLAWFWSGMLIWPLAQYHTSKRAEAIEKGQNNEKSAKSLAVFTAESALSNASAELESLQQRCADLLAKAKRMIEP